MMCVFLTAGCPMFWTTMFVPMIHSFYGWSPETAGLLLLAAAPMFLLFTPVSSMILSRQILKRRQILIFSYIIVGVFMMFGTGNLTFGLGF